MQRHMDLILVLNNRRAAVQQAKPFPAHIQAVQYLTEHMVLLRGARWTTAAVGVAPGSTHQPQTSITNSQLLM